MRLFHSLSLLTRLCLVGTLRAAELDMSTPKNSTAKHAESLGTTIAEVQRKKSNKFSEQKRQQLLERGIALIYGGKGKAKAATNNG